MSIATRTCHASSNAPCRSSVAWTFCLPMPAMVCTPRCSTRPSPWPARSGDQLLGHDPIDQGCGGADAPGALWPHPDLLQCVQRDRAAMYGHYAATKGAQALVAGALRPNWPTRGRGQQHPSGHHANRVRTARQPAQRRSGQRIDHAGDGGAVGGARRASDRAMPEAPQAGGVAHAHGTLGLGLGNAIPSLSAWGLRRRARRLGGSAMTAASGLRKPTGLRRIRIDRAWCAV